jgi:hypothetical protein
MIFYHFKTRMVEEEERRNGQRVGPRQCGTLWALPRRQAVARYLLRLSVLALALFLPAASVSALTGPTGAAAPSLKVVATNLNNPRKLFVGPDGALYVVEAGTGGSAEVETQGAKCFGTCIGQTGSITRIEHGISTRVVTGLGSVANVTRQAAEGPAAVVVAGDTYYLLMEDMNVTRQGLNPYGLSDAGDLISTRAGKVAPRVIAKLATFEAAHNPDRGAGAGPRFGDPIIDSNPYALTAYQGGFAVVDASADDLLWVSPKGTVSVLAVFPARTAKLTRSLDRDFGFPLTKTSILARSVPTGVTVGPDGALYVGELTGRPYQPGSARVWRIVPGEKPTVFASGFTCISDLAFDGKNLLVLEISSKGLETSSPGALIRLAPNGSRTVIASRGLVDPTGLAVGNGSIYISDYGTDPGSGTGPHGEVVALPAAAGS